MVFPPCLLHALLPRGKQGTSHEPFRQLRSGLKIPEVFTEVISTQFREGEHKRDWALWVLAGRGLGLQSAALSCEPKRWQGPSALGVQGEAQDSHPFRLHMNANWRESRVLGWGTQHWCLWGRLPWKRAGQGGGCRSVFTCNYVVACMQGCTVRGHLYLCITDPRDLLSTHPGERTSRGRHLREHLCAVSSLSHDSKGCSCVVSCIIGLTGLFSGVLSVCQWKRCLDMVSSWPAANLSQPWGGNHKPRRGLIKKTFSL